jgi:hypothetical protein
VAAKSIDGSLWVRPPLGFGCAGQCTRGSAGDRSRRRYWRRLRRIDLRPAAQIEYVELELYMMWRVNG